MKTKNAENTNTSAQTEKSRAANIFAKTNRGMLLDIVVFLANIFLMHFLAKGFFALLKNASAGDEFAYFALFLFCVAIFILPPLGATLKRWHFHRRLQLKGKTSARPEVFLGGCLFNPIFYFCLNVLIFSTLNAFVMQFIYGDKEANGAVFVPSILFGTVLMIFQTIVVYRYFVPPKNAPASEFLRSPRSGILGDACIFLNMILYQVLWNTITMIPMNRPENVSIPAEIFFRLFFLGFASLFIYFPPRLFYLAEDINRRRAWLTILLANSPVISRLLYGAFTN